MSQYLPVKDFEWVDTTTITESTIMSWGDEDDKGYILEVCIIL